VTLALVLASAAGCASITPAPSSARRLLGALHASHTSRGLSSSASSSGGADGTGEQECACLNGPKGWREALPDWSYRQEQGGTYPAARYPLHNATARLDVAAVRLLLQGGGLGLDEVAAEAGDTPLHVAFLTTIYSCRQLWVP
jgi:hypothetical protein